MREPIVLVVKDFRQKNIFLDKIAKQHAHPTTIQIVYINAQLVVLCVLHAKGQIKIAHHVIQDIISQMELALTLQSILASTTFMHQLQELLWAFLFC
jgi:hypothetical protein